MVLTMNKFEKFENNDITKGPERGVLLDTKIKTKKPSMYNVILLNDDYTPMEFVVYVLIEIFHHPPERAERIMLSVHKDGMGVAGIYHLEIAEQKAYETAEEAKSNQFPLKVKIEKVA